MYGSNPASGADPGFPGGGGANPRGGAPTYDFVKFSENLHEIEKILGCRGGARQGCPPKSATEYLATSVIPYRQCVSPTEKDSHIQYSTEIKEDGGRGCL